MAHLIYLIAGKIVVGHVRESLNLSETVGGCGKPLEAVQCSLMSISIF